MRSNRCAVAFAAAVMALGCAAPASAGSAGKPTTVVFVGSGYVSDGTTSRANAYGRLETAKRCLGGRTVKIYAFIGQTKKLVDVDRSSRNGSWAGEGSVPGSPDGYQVVAERAKRGKVVCREGSVAT
ncbi:hypothetical protein HJD18_13900 [Thermoleophilia bacterium SCSIO 60948]|nr:hypothetical protein HJD18_13900 [Thermoleophilia bacterium SCSIO 60948]